MWLLKHIKLSVEPTSTSQLQVQAISNQSHISDAQPLHAGSLHQSFTMQKETTIQCFSVFQYVKSSVIGLRRSVRLDKPFCFEPVLLSATLPTDKTSTVRQQNSKLHANFFRSSNPTYISRLYLRAPFQNEPRQLSTLMQSNS